MHGLFGGGRIHQRTSAIGASRTGAIPQPHPGPASLSGIHPYAFSGGLTGRSRYGCIFRQGASAHLGARTGAITQAIPPSHAHTTSASWGSVDTKTSSSFHSFQPDFLEISERSRRSLLPHLLHCSCHLLLTCGPLFQRQLAYQRCRRAWDHDILRIPCTRRNQNR